MQTVSRDAVLAQGWWAHTSLLLGPASTRTVSPTAVPSHSPTLHARCDSLPCTLCVTLQQRTPPLAHSVPPPHFSPPLCDVSACPAAYKYALACRVSRQKQTWGLLPPRCSCVPNLLETLHKTHPLVIYTESLQSITDHRSSEGRRQHQQLQADHSARANPDSLCSRYNSQPS